MTPLVWLFRVPTPIVLAGRQWHALPLRLRDLAELASLACAGWTAPAVPESDPLTPEGRAEWLDAVDAAESEVPDWGTEGCSAVVFGTRPGRALMLAAALRGHSLSYLDAAEMTTALSAEEWAVVDRVAFAAPPGVDVIAALDRALGVPPCDRSGEGPARTLAEAVAEFANETGAPLAEMAEWTIGEFAARRRGGKAAGVWDAPDQERDPIGWQHYEDEVQPRRRAFFKGPAAG